MNASVGDRVIDIIAEQAVLDLSEVKPDATLEALGLDSLGLVEVVFAIEEAFDISVPYNANEPTDVDFDLSTVQSVIDGVQSLLDAQKTNA